MRRRRFTVHVWHRRRGKTQLMLYTLVNAAMRFENRPERMDGRFMYIAPLRTQAKSILWTRLTNLAAKIPGCIVNKSELYIELPHNKARVSLFGASDPDSLRGAYADAACFDEPGQMDAMVWTEVVRPMLADRPGSWATFIGTPKGINFFHKLYHEDALRVGWGRTLYRVDEDRPPWLPQSEVDEMRLDMSEIKFRQEMLCDFTASAEDVLITIDEVSKACARPVVHAVELRGLPRVMGIDLARYKDRSVIYKRQGRMAFAPMVYRNIDHMVLAGIIAAEIVEWKPDAVFIDSAGAGTLVDLLRQWGHEITLVNFGEKATTPRYANKRAEMWFLMGRWIREVGSFQESPFLSELKTELTSVTYTYDSQNALLLVPKEQLRKELAKQNLPSPDIADALALTFYAPVSPKASNAPEVERYQQQVFGQQEYVPY